MPDFLSGASAPAFFVDGSVAYFAATDGASAPELWRTAGPGDPGGSGAVLVAPVPGGLGSNPGGFARTTDGTVYFTASPTWADADRSLYRVRTITARWSGSPGPAASSRRPACPARRPSEPRLLLRPRRGRQRRDPLSVAV